MKDVTEKIGTAYFDVSLRLTSDQCDEIVRQELMAQLHSASGIPKKVVQAMIEVLIWYTPDGQPQEITDNDWRRQVQ